MTGQVPQDMRAMLLQAPRQPLVPRRVRLPRVQPGQVLVRVSACGVCRTDLHIADDELQPPSLPLILGHEIVGSVVQVAEDVAGLEVGARVGVPWLAWTDQTCALCLAGRENLCPAARFTGYHVDGGYAEYVAANADYCFPLPDQPAAAQAAPLLCAGLIGYRTWRLAGDNVEHLGIYGFGAAAHIIAQVASHQGQRVYAFTRPGDRHTQDFARHLGAAWAGGSDQRPPHPLDAALIFAPVGSLVVAALEATAPGGSVVCGGIHMSDIPSFAYSLLWQERQIRSVANLTREDGHAFFDLIAGMQLRISVRTFAPDAANDALEAMRHGALTGAAVLDWGA